MQELLTDSESSIVLAGKFILDTIRQLPFADDFLRTVRPTDLSTTAISPRQEMTDDQSVASITRTSEAFLQAASTFFEAHISETVSSFSLREFDAAEVVSRFKLKDVIKCSKCTTNLGLATILVDSAHIHGMRLPDMSPYLAQSTALLKRLIFKAHLEAYYKGEHDILHHQNIRYDNECSASPNQAHDPHETLLLSRSGSTDAADHNLALWAPLAGDSNESTPEPLVSCLTPHLSVTSDSTLDPRSLHQVYYQPSHYDSSTAVAEYYNRYTNYLTSAVQAQSPLASESPLACPLSSIESHRPAPTEFTTGTSSLAEAKKYDKIGPMSSTLDTNKITTHYLPNEQLISAAEIHTLYTAVAIIEVMKGFRECPQLGDLSSFRTDLPRLQGSDIPGPEMLQSVERGQQSFSDGMNFIIAASGNKTLPNYRLVSRMIIAMGLERLPGTRVDVITSLNEAILTSGKVIERIRGKLSLHTGDMHPSFHGTGSGSDDTDKTDKSVMPDQCQGPSRSSTDSAPPFPSEHPEGALSELLPRPGADDKIADRISDDELTKWERWSQGLPQVSDVRTISEPSRPSLINGLTWSELLDEACSRPSE
ncbi:hypothetical protein TREMEDRAFT_61145 [Tremella mesenterica DSM 1558]|uniref:uncharacterized protein n=1 Tax=Tremella mesenterica (strain ATCC 24925 / CBS 8224 / DSM 1558 / NBRC 9311 / NRRL Y-6157 / RJB 2259-6 / UBC 559-6) TaxID=578456 RepID=UPI0003F49028|nr:uncharacterized protein TREMEDRAFT_61145 [Tremella mesenterica DSM 1558]EIW70636.1 hypothetical protein TREMEDRAFT_61145 [Tremella mesenterica DSM 1558]